MSNYTTQVRRDGKKLQLKLTETDLLGITYTWNPRLSPRAARRLISQLHHALYDMAHPGDNVRRALLTQQRRHACGLCIECGIPAVDGWRCLKHKRASARKVRDAYRKKVGI